MGVKNYYVDVGRSVDQMAAMDQEKISASVVSLSALADSLERVNMAANSRMNASVTSWAQAFTNIGVAVAVSAAAIWVVTWAITSIAGMLGA